MKIRNRYGFGTCDACGMTCTRVERIGEEGYLCVVPCVRHRAIGPARTDGPTFPNPRHRATA